MLFIISMALALLLVCFGDKALKKHPVPFYIAGALVTVAVIAVSQTDMLRTMPGIVRDYIIAVFSKGSFATALWCVVMWAGAFPNGSAPIKKLMPIRGELSIFASAITLSHIVTYGIQYVKTLSNNIRLNRDPATEFILTCIIAVVLILIMFPLAVMSFKVVRKKMNPKMWKKIQRSAYVFYALIYMHIMVLYIPQARRGITEKYISIILYSIVFIGYALMRIRKAYIKKNPEKSTSSYVICGISAVILIGLSAVLSYGKAPERKIPDTVTTAISTTAQADTTTTSVSDEKADESTTTAVSTSGTQSTSSGETETSTNSTSTETTTESETIESTDDEENGDNPDESETTPVEEEAEPEQNEEPQSEPEPEPEPQYMYNNGTYSGTAYGYAGDITVTITIENDIIVDIQAYADGDDPDYYDYAMYYVLPQIQQSMSADVDAYAGATYSSQGIMDAARNALFQALR